MSALLKAFLSFRQPLDRRPYWLGMIVLLAICYAGMTGVWFAGLGHVFNPLELFIPVFAWRSEHSLRGHDHLVEFRLLWPLPFAMIGTWLSARRAYAAKFSILHGLWFLVPGANLILVLLLGFLPSRRTADLAGVQNTDAQRLARMRTAFLSAFLAVPVGVSYMVFSVYALESYGIALFIATPFLMGALSGFLLNRREDHGFRATLSVACLAITITGGTVLLLALEGVYCLVMAAGLAYPLAIFGGLIGHGVARKFSSTSSSRALPALLLLPLMGLVEKQWPLPLPTPRLVVSTIEINASPEVVWHYVVDVPDLPPPREYEFRSGIAYPTGARSDRAAVGAKRYCHFNTGEVVETITALEPQRRLQFRVESQPPPMTELSPYRGVVAPHLDGFVSSEVGEFQLEPLADGRTRLIGRSWYRTGIAPAMYWGLLSDYFVHLIHHRVFGHIKSLAEGESLKTASRL